MTKLCPYHVTFHARAGHLYLLGHYHTFFGIVENRQHYLRDSKMYRVAADIRLYFESLVFSTLLITGSTVEGALSQHSLLPSMPYLIAPIPHVCHVYFVCGEVASSPSALVSPIVLYAQSSGI